VSLEESGMVARARLTPYVLLGVLTLGTGLGIGVGMSEAPASSGRSLTSPPPIIGPTQPTLPPTLPPPPITVPPSTTTTIPYLAASARCETSRLQLGVGPYVSEKTQQRSVMLTLTNQGPDSCYLFGFPGISMYDADGNPLPLVDYLGGDQMVTSSPPQRVGLAVGGTAFVLLNRNECGISPEDRATSVQVIPPDDTSGLMIAVTTIIATCPQGSSNTLDISPVEPSFELASHSP
jgi:hypothetical protein